jgi:hypothetical protein
LAISDAARDTLSIEPRIVETRSTAKHRREASRYLAIPTV